MQIIKSSLMAQVLEQVQKDYYENVKMGTKLSIMELLNFDDFKIQNYCKPFKPHADSDKLKIIAQTFGEEHGIWLTNAKHHITCALFLYPNAEFDRMLAMMKNLTIDFYLNDVMGRDLFRYLPRKEKEQARDIIERMGNVNEYLILPQNCSAIERTNIEVLRHFRDTSNGDWFKRFIKLYSYHIGVTHKDCNAAAIGHISSVSEYISMRCHYAGMHHIVIWTEYSTGQFLDWTWLKMMNIAKEMKRLHYVIAAFGALSNDLFSFEKEVIDNGTDANLLMVIALNSPHKKFIDIIRKSAFIVSNLLKEYVTIMNFIKEQCSHLPSSAMLSLLEKHIADLETGMQACWMWQVYTKRYKRSDSIFIETNLENEMAIAI